MGQISMQIPRINVSILGAIQQSTSIRTGKILAGALIVAVLSAVSPLSQAVSLLETFEDETNGSTTFSEPGGPGFTTDTDLLVEQFPNLGSGGSNFWLGTGFVGIPNGSGGSSGYVGSITVDSGWSFIINSFDAWTGQNDGNIFFAGTVRFIGTKIDNSVVQTDIAINTLNDTDFVTGLNFTGTTLDGIALTSLSFELVTGAPFDYLALDNINYDASRLSPPPNGVPEPTTLALMGLGLAGIGYQRRRSKRAA